MSPRDVVVPPLVSNAVGHVSRVWPAAPTERPPSRGDESYIVETLRALDRIRHLLWVVTPGGLNEPLLFNARYALARPCGCPLFGRGR